MDDDISVMGEVNSDVLFCSVVDESKGAEVTVVFVC